MPCRSASNKKRDVSEQRDFRKDNRVFRKRQKASGPTIKKKKRKHHLKSERRKKGKKKKKGNRQTRDTTEIRSQWRAGRHLLMAPLELEPAYDADDIAARPGGPRVAGRRENAANPPRARRREGAGRTEADGSKIDSLGQAQIRGGQDCTSRGHPANIDAAKYLESAHCLRFSDLW